MYRFLLLVLTLVLVSSVALAAAPAQAPARICLYCGAETTTDVCGQCHELSIAWTCIECGTRNLSDTCSKCGKEYHIEHYDFWCPECENGVLTTISGREMQVEYLEVD